GDPIHANARTQLIEINVAGLDYRLVQIDGAVAFFFPIPESAVAEVVISGIENPRLGLQNAFFQACDRHDDLKGGTRWVLSLSGAVAKWPEAVFDQVAPLFGLDAAGKNVRIEGRRADHRQDGAAIHIERDNGSFFAVERLESGLLQLAVQCQMNRITGNIRNFMKHAHTPTQGIDLDLLPAALAPENFFPAAFQTVLSNFISRDVPLVFKKL